MKPGSIPRARSDRRCAGLRVVRDSRGASACRRRYAHRSDTESEAAAYLVAARSLFFGNSRQPVYRWVDGAPRARGGAGSPRRCARRRGPRNGPRRLRHRRAGDRQDLARHPVPAGSRPARPGCSSAPATTSRSRGRSARSATSRAASRRRSSEALAAGARAARDPDPARRGARASAAADRARARGRALGRRRDLRLDHRARPPDRLPAGAARPDLPRRRGAARPPAPRRGRRDPGRRLACSSSWRRSRSAPSPRSPATTRARCTPRRGGNPFYVTELLCLARAERPAAVGRERRARPRRAARRPTRAACRARVRRAEPRAHARCSTPCMPELARGGGGARAPAAARGRRRHVRFRHELARHAIAVEHPGRRAAAPPRGDPRGAARGRRRPGRRSSTTRRPRARRTSSPTTRSSPHGGRRRSTPTARRTPTTGAPRTSPSGCRRPSRRACSRSSPRPAYAVEPAR